MVTSSRYQITFLVLENISTKFDILDKAKHDGVKIEVITFTDNSIVISVPRRALMEGHIVSAELNAEIREHTFQLKATGKITRLNQITKIVMEATIELKQFDRDLWQQFLEHIANDQNRVKKLFTAIKGVDEE